MADFTAAAVVKYLATQSVYELCTIAATAALIYDSLLTLSTEVSVIWKQKLRIGSLIYVINHYAQIVSCVLSVRILFPVRDRECAPLAIGLSVCTVLPYLSWAAFSTLRIYALSDRNIILAASVAILTGSYAIPDVYQYIYVSYQNLPSPFNCQSIEPAPFDVTGPLLWTSRGLTLIGESLVVFWTVKETYNSYRPCLPSGKAPNSVSETVLANGLLCFSIPLVLNACSLGMLVTKYYRVTLVWSAINIFRDAITSTLVSRFILQLGKLAQESVHNSAASTLTTQFPETSDLTTTDIPAFINPAATAEA